MKGKTMDNACICSGRKTVRDEEERTKLINRLARIEGQIRGIRGMVEKDAYCGDVLMQCAAVNAAVNAFCRDLVTRHIKTCVARDLKEGKEGVAEELAATLEKLMK